MSREEFVSKYMHLLMIDLDNRATVPGIQGVYRADKALIVFHEFLDKMTLAVDKVTEKVEISDSMFSKPTPTIPGADTEYKYREPS